MKLRNKKTGIIEECVVIPIDENGYPNEYQVFEKGTSLAELNEEWEDAPEEPKEYYCITGRGNLHFIEDMGDEGDKDRKQIGNYFETKEEAEKAVEKLKAWKRLKDKNFHFSIKATNIIKMCTEFVDDEDKAECIYSLDKSLFKEVKNE